MRSLWFLFMVLLVGWFLVLAGCGGGGDHYRPYDPTEGGTGGSATTSTGGDIFDTTSASGEGGGPACDGECHLWNSALFEDLSMFWIGPPGEAPPCPDDAPAVGAVLRADPLPSPYMCPACSCAPAGCALPEEMRVSAAKCPADGAASIAWDSPSWGGSCTAEGAIPPGLLCSGVPCTQSITIAAPTVEPCAPVAQGPEIPTDPAWGLAAQECIFGPLSGEGCGGSEACLQSPPEDFSLCLYRWGDDLNPEYCPEEYPRYLVMYAGDDDTRACEPCSCADPQGAECSALVSVFTDGACGALLGSYTVTSALDEVCVDLPPGVGLGSKAGTLTVNKPGSCAPSGGPVGGVAPTLPLTLCCQNEPPPPAE